uniref:Transmembrane channel-like protein 3 n=1 Tax=Cacopsylla melanoneura TaxID=428564 RepID=A0A8D8Z4V7_9HEMI
MSEMNITEETSSNETNTGMPAPESSETIGQKRTPGIVDTKSDLVATKPQIPLFNVSSETNANINQTGATPTLVVKTTQSPVVHQNDSNKSSENSTPSMLENSKTSVPNENQNQNLSHLDNNVILPPTKSVNTEMTASSKMCIISVCEEKTAEYTSEHELVRSTVETRSPSKTELFCTHTLETPTRKKLRNLCWETKIGQELVRLTVVDLVTTIGLTILSDAGRALFVRYMNPCWCWDLEKTFPKYADFNIAENILGLVYNQGYVWIGMFFAPGLPLINLIKLMVLMYLNSWAVLTSNVPHEVVFRASRSNNFYLALLLLQLFLAVLPVGYTIVAIEPSWHCGPFSGHDRIYNIFTKSIKDWLPKSSHQVLDYLASPGTIIPLLILLILIIYYLASLTSALKEANIDLKIQLRRERTEERRKMYQLVAAKKKSSGDELLDSTLSKWRDILPDTPVEKTATDSAVLSGKPTKEHLMMKFIHKTRRKTSDTSACDKSDEEKERPASSEKKNNEINNAETKQGDKKVYHKRQSSSSIWSSDNIPEIKISESINSDVNESEEHDHHHRSRRKAPFQTGSTDTVIEINEPHDKHVKLDNSPGRFKTPRKTNNSVVDKSDAINGSHSEDVRRGEKEDDAVNGEKRHKKRNKLESSPNMNVKEESKKHQKTENRTGEIGNSQDDVRKHIHSTNNSDAYHRKHRLKKLSKENLDKLQVQLELEDEEHNMLPIRRKPTESSSEFDEIHEKIGQDRKRKSHKDRLTAGNSSLEKSNNSLEVEIYRNLSREFISPKRKQLLKQLKYKNRRYQIYCDDVMISRSLEHEHEFHQLGTPQRDENKSKSLNHLLENR